MYKVPEMSIQLQKSEPMTELTGNGRWTITVNTIRLMPSMSPLN
jgi:hypothetical protein